MKRFAGCTVTMDGLTKKIYLGEQVLRAAKREEISVLFEPQSVPAMQDFESGWEFLVAWDRGVELDGVRWTFNPNWKMCPAWREMLSQGYPRRVDIINACRQSCAPLPRDTLVHASSFSLDWCRVLRVDITFMTIETRPSSNIRCGCVTCS